MNKRICAGTMATMLAMSLVITGNAAETVEPIKIEFWLSDVEADGTGLEAYNYALELYNERHPEAPMEIEYVWAADPSAYVQKLLMAAESDTLPELFMSAAADVDGVEETGAIIELTEYLENDAEWNDRFIDGTFDLSRSFTDGKTYGIPAFGECSGWFLNKRLFDEQGLEIPVTWEEWKHCIETFVEAGITPIAFGAVDAWSRWGFDILMNRYGVAENAEALGNGELKFEDLVIPAYEKIDEMAKMGAFPSNVATATYTEAEELFKGGKAAIFTAGSWTVAALVGSPEADNYVFSWGPEFSDSESEQKVATKMVSWCFYVGKKAAEDEAKLNAVLEYIKIFSESELVDYRVENEQMIMPVEYTGSGELPNLFLDVLAKNADEYRGYNEIAFYMDPSFASVYWNTVSSIITQTATPEEAAQQLDECLELLR